MDPLSAMPPAKAAAATSTFAVIAGVIVIAVWLLASAVWAGMVVMGGLMANDAGRVSSERHLALLAMTMAGVALVGLAGVPIGLSLFWSAMRATLLWTAAGMCAAGLALQAAAVWLFRSAAS